MDPIDRIKIGIVGCGHLGRAIARSLVRVGFGEGSLLLTHGGNPLTAQALESEGLAGCLSENRVLFREADVVFLAVRPQDAPGIGGFQRGSGTLLVSCMAGVSADLLKRIFGGDVVRMMFSGPDTLLSGKGMAAVFPENGTVESLFRSAGLTVLPVRSEGELDVFTVGVCLIPALLERGDSRESREAVGRIGKKYALFSQLYEWAAKLLPRFENDADRQAYLARMATKGGVTEAVVGSLRRGDPLDAALQAGLGRTAEIGEEIRRSLSGPA